jgi:adenylylsulfate kinase
MACTILVMGLPGSGKTTFAEKLAALLGDNVDWYNADKVRQLHNDWDFSPEGRMRQAKRMKDLATASNKQGRYAICDFVCPTYETQSLFASDIIIWMDTIKEGRFEDTNKIFQRPQEFMFWIDSWDYEDELLDIAYMIVSEHFDWTKPTVQMMGRYQPFHDGHKALFEEALKKTGQVAIFIRKMPEDEKNPFGHRETETYILKKLSNYLGKFQIVWVPNIVDISYGRDVGYTISKIELPEDIQAISATKIRKEMGIG